VSTIAIALREWRSLFRLPVGWIVIALFLLLTGIVFAYETLSPGAPASLRNFFSLSGFMLMVVAPAISMRLLSEEYRMGTWEVLSTLPVRESSIVVGKYAGACLFLVSMFLPTLAYVAVLYRFADPAPDPGPILAGYLALALLGLFYLSIGLCCSAITSNQTLAFLATLMTIFAIHMASARLPALLPEPFASIVRELGFAPRAADFARGIVDLAHVAYFLAGSAWFVLAAYIAVLARRWR
jgi:ABC-2 type transport system permease protein